MKKNLPYIFILIVIFSVIYFRWILGGIFAHSDWLALTQFSISSWSYPSIWTLGDFGSINFVLARAPITAVFAQIISHIDFISIPALEWIFYYFPIVFVLPIAGFLLVNQIVRSRLAGIVGALIIALNTYFLAIDTAGHLLITCSCAFASLSLFFYLKYFETKENHYLICSSLLLCLSGYYDFRILYILLGIFFLYSLFFSYMDRKSFFWVPFIFVCLVSAIANIFWIAPQVYSSSFLDNEVLNRGLFGNSFMDIAHSITLYHPFWTGAEPEWFVRQSVAWFFWLIPLSAFAGLILNRKNKSILFFALVALLGIFLSKQVGEPMQGIYQWLYENLPGFNAFREASKFYFLVVLGYAVLIGSLIAWMDKKAVTPRQIMGKRIVIFLVAGLFLWNAKPLITGEIGTILVPRTIPDDYSTFNNFVSQQSGYFRTFWTPTDSWWGFYDANHPKVSDISVVESKWDKLFKGQNSNSLLIQDKIVDIFKHRYSDGLFDLSSIKYVVVPLQDTANDNDFFVYYGGEKNSDIRNWYINELDQIGFLKRIDIGTKDLAVYENENYKPYIFASNKLDGIESFGDLDEIYNYLSNDIEDVSAFYDLNEYQLPSSRIYLPFSSLTSSSIAKNKINVSIFDDNATADIFVNVGKKNVAIKYSLNSLSVSKTLKNSVSINGAQIGLEGGTEVLYASSVVDANYYAFVGSRLISIKKGDSAFDFGVITEPFDIYVLDKNNAIPNASFEAGKWSEIVSDCNDYDTKPILDMQVSNDATDGKASIQLDATNHIACTGQIGILVEGGQDYLFGFDYQSPNAQTAGYYLQFNDATSTVVSEKLPVVDTDWNTFQKKIEVPKDATEMNLVIYSYSRDNKTKITTRYDNFKLGALEHIVTVDPKYSQNFAKVNIPTKNEYGFEYSDTGTDLSNLIDNPSLEKGLWSEEVGDCNNFDGDGRLSMSLSKDHKTEGDYSLQLGATRHIACTSPRSMPLTEGRTYLFSFDYQSSNGKEAGYYLGFNDPKKTAISERLPLQDTKWHNFTRQFKAPAGASMASIAVYAYADNGKEERIDRYDNFHFVKLPDLEDRYFLVTKPREKLSEPAAVEFESINATKKKVHISGATTPFYLVMSESYQSKWQAQMDNQKIRGTLNGWVPWVDPDRIADDKHLAINGFLNGWYVETDRLCVDNPACIKNPDGSYDMEMVIEFFPQRWFYLGAIVSASAFLGCLAYLVYYRRKRKKGKKI